jgi:hypothetical protein
MCDNIVMKTIHNNEITNSCNCLTYEEDGEEKSIDTEYGSDCYGDCWDFAFEDFCQLTHEFFENNATYYFHIGGLKLWDREVSGIAECKTPLDLLNAMTVKSDWSMKYTVHADCIEYSLSHHDAPMGSASFVRHATDEQIENNRY